MFGSNDLNLWIWRASTLAGRGGLLVLPITLLVSLYLMPLFPTVLNAFIDDIGTILLSQCHLRRGASQCCNKSFSLRVVYKTSPIITPKKSSELTLISIINYRSWLEREIFLCFVVFFSNFGRSGKNASLKFDIRWWEQNEEGCYLLDSITHY